MVWGIREGLPKEVRLMLTSAGGGILRKREQHLKEPGVKVSHTFKEAERRVCFVHKELGI